jgi:LPXTG-motif cell wall-anchored protein
MAEDAPGHWVPVTHYAATAVNPVAVDSAAGHVMWGTFDPGDPPGHVHTVVAASGVAVHDAPVGLAPQFVQASVNETTHRLYVSVYGSAEVRVVDTVSGEVVHTFTRDDWMPWSAAVDSVHDRVYVVDGNDNAWNPTGSVTVIDGATNMVVATVDAPDALAYPAFSEHHHELYIPVEGESGGSLLVFDADTNAFVDPITSPSIANPTMVIVDDELDRMFVLQFDPDNGRPSIVVIDLTTKQVVHEQELPADDVVVDSGMAYDSARALILVGVDSHGGGLPQLVSIDARSGHIVARDPIPLAESSGTQFAAAGAGVFGIAVDSATAAAYVTLTDNRVAVLQWVPTAPARLPNTGLEGAPMIGFGAGALALLVAGVGLALVRRRNARA